MKTYEIKKVLSNNVVLVKGDTNSYILIGKGIGFGKKKGNYINYDHVIEQAFLKLDNLNSVEQKMLVNEIDSSVFELTKELVEFASKELGEKLNSKIHLILIDHINFAIKRLKEGLEIVNPFLNETKILYPEEYRIAEKAVDMMSSYFKLNIPEAEIGFIALHIYGGRHEHTKSEALEQTRLIKDITEYIEHKLEIDFSKIPYNHSRFIIHLKALLTRITREEPNDNKIVEKLMDDFSFEVSLAKGIAKIIESSLKKELPDNEIGYIALHLNRLMKMK